MNNTFSLKKLLKNSTIIILIMVCAIFSLDFYFKNSINNQYEKIASTTSDINDIYSRTFLAERNFELYYQTKNIEYYDEYVDHFNFIQNKLAFLQKDFAKYSGTLLFSRVLSQSIEGQEIYINKNFFSNTPEDSEYYNFTLASEHFTIIRSNASALMASYMNYSSNQYQIIHHRYETILLFQILIIFLFSLFAFVSIRYFIYDIANTSKQIIVAANALSNQKWDMKDLQTGKYDELNTVITTFNNMKNSITYFIQQMNEKRHVESLLHRQILENKTQQNLLMESNYKILQMQMNPHFLFNTLNLIIRVVQCNENQKAIKLIKATSDVLRNNLNCRDLIIPVKKELETLYAYISILNERLSGRAAITIIENGIPDNVFIPPFTLQTIVENSIKHGLIDTLKGGIVNITFEDHYEFLLITIYDNGKGDDQKVFDSILSRKPDKGIGLYNTYERLKMYFPQEDVMTIKSEIGVGTTVTLKLCKKGNLDV